MNTDYIYIRDKGSRFRKHERVIIQVRDLCGILDRVTVEDLIEKVNFCGKICNKKALKLVAHLLAPRAVRRRPGWPR